jgi:thioredoxin 1
MTQVLRFTASWCQPCKALASILEEIKTDIPIKVIDIDNDQELAKKYGIRGVPTLVKLDGEKVVSTMVGVKAKNLVEEWLNGK